MEKIKVGSILGWGGCIPIAIGTPSICEFPFFIERKQQLRALDWRQRGSNVFIEQKLNYIHQNPVRAGLVEEPWHYKYSSAIDYSGGKGLIEIDLIA